MAASARSNSNKNGNNNNSSDNNGGENSRKRKSSKNGADILRLSQRDIDGLLLCAEHYAAPYDLLGQALGVGVERLPEIVKRWRNIGYAASGRLGPGPTWCWLTREGMSATGFRYSAGKPSMGRLAHTRAVLAARLWLESGPAWQQRQGWWCSERRLHTGRGQPGRAPSAGSRSLGGHMPDAEVHWPSLEDSPYAGQIWAMEVELTAKPVARTTSIMTELIWANRYAAIVYLTSPGARHVVTTAALRLPEADRVRIAIRTPSEGRARPGADAGFGAFVMTVWSWIRLRIYLWLLRKGLKVAGWAMLGLLALALWPVTGIAILGVAVAWLRGWPPVRLARAALWALPMTFIATVDRAVHVHSWRALALAPVRTWQASWHHLGGYPLVRTAVLLSPVAIPAGLGLASLLWLWRIFAISSGHAGWLASAPITFDTRLWGRQVRTARGRTAAQGLVPLLAGRGRIPVGGTIRSIGHRWHPVFSVPSTACARHMVVIGATGSGKTNLMMRLWAGWFAATLETSGSTGRRPALIVLDCKGGLDAREKAERTKRLLYGAGARRVAIWPEQASLSLWDLPPGDLAVLLFQMIESGDGAAAYYADIMQAVVMLAVTAPAGPPLSAAGFLDRLSARWLHAAWDDGRHPTEMEWVRAATRHMPDIQLRFVTLLQRLGPGLDGPGNLADADVWYFILEGTREPSVAEAQAMAITELTAAAATSAGGQHRAQAHAAGRRRLQRGVRAGAAVQPVRAGPLARHRHAGLGPVVAGSWRGRGRAVPDRGHRRRRDLGAGDSLPRAAVRAGRAAAGAGHRPADGRGGLGTRRHHLRAPGLGGRPGADPAAGHRAGLLHPPRRGHLRPGGPAPAVAADADVPAAAGRASGPAAAPAETGAAREPGPEPPPVPTDLDAVLGPGGPW